MNELAMFLKKICPNTLGEALREITFIGKGYGCYESFEVRTDAVGWTKDQLEAFVNDRFDHLDGNDYVVEKSYGYTFQEGSLTIEVFWFWDGDGYLHFRVKEGKEVIGEIFNSDCKCGHEWKEE